ncbi:MAG: WD40/YVTN/BNR-like repeat-containing protein, partial [Anaerolineales bacterium]
WVASGSGLFWFRQDGAEWEQLGHALAEQELTCIDASNGTVIVGGVDGVMRSLDGGATWQAADDGLSVRHARWVATQPAVPGVVLLGTEPAAIFRSGNYGASWTNCPEIAALRKAGRWFLPYSPESGCIRGLALHGERAYAAAEVGGALRSDDAGRTWRLTEGSQGKAQFEEPPPQHIHPDVHSILTHPASADFVYAPTGGGFYLSRDGGKTWELRYECYCRAVWVDPADPDHLMLGPADDVDANGRIEQTRDGGLTWEVASVGLKVPWRRHMVERFTQVRGGLLAVLSNGDVLFADSDSLEWRPILEDVPDVRAIAVSGQ